MYSVIRIENVKTFLGGEKPLMEKYLLHNYEHNNYNIRYGLLRPLRNKDFLLHLAALSHRIMQLI